jgi:hypothetical protein
MPTINRLAISVAREVSVDAKPTTNPMLVTTADVLPKLTRRRRTRRVIDVRARCSMDQDPMPRPIRTSESSPSKGVGPADAVVEAITYTLEQLPHEPYLGLLLTPGRIASTAKASHPTRQSRSVSP